MIGKMWHGDSALPKLWQEVDILPHGCHQLVDTQNDNRVLTDLFLIVKKFISFW